MLKEQADQIVAAFSSHFRGREIEILTRGNEDARDAGIAQQYRVRTYFGSAGGHVAALDREDMVKLIEITHSASTVENQVELDLLPVDRGMLEIRVVLE